MVTGESQAAVVAVFVVVAVTGDLVDLVAGDVVIGGVDIVPVVVDFAALLVSVQIRTRGKADHSPQR